MIPIRAFAFVGLLTPILAAPPAGAAIQVDVVAGASPARPGETLDVDITVTNDGGSDLTDVEVVLDYPANVQAAFEVWFDGNCPSSACESGEQTIFLIDSLDAGKGVTFSMPIRVTNVATNGTIIPFDVDVFDNAALAASGTTQVVVDASREVELGMVESQDPVAPDGTLTYAITYGVLASSAGSPQATLSLPLPSGTSFVSANRGGTEAAGVVTWDLGNVAPGDGGERLVTLQVDSSADVGSIVRATATYEDLASNETSYEVNTRVQNAIPLQLTAIVSPDPARNNETIDVELTVTNTGFFDRSGVQVRYVHPDHVTQMFETWFDGDCPSSACENPERAVFDVGTLAAGQGVTFSLPVKIAAAASAETGTVITFRADVIDGIGDQAAAGASIAIADDRAFELVMVDDREPVAQKENITYKLTYGLLESASGVAGAMMQMPVPDGTTFVSASDGGSVTGGVIMWGLGNLNPGMTGERTAVVAVNGSVSDGAVITAEATVENPAATANGTRYQASTRVQSDNAMDLDIIASPDPAKPGEVMDVEITVTNTSAFDVTDVVLRMETPDQLSQMFELWFDGDCPSSACEDRERAVFTVGTIAAGEGLTFSVPIVIANDVEAGTVIPIEVDASNSQGDTRRASAGVAVDGGRALDLAMVESDEPVAPGALLTYTITYGTVDLGATGVMLRFPIPDGTFFQTASNCGELNVADGAVEWNLGALDPGEGGERKVTVLVDAGAAEGAILSATAFLDEDGTPAQMRFDEATRVQSDAPIDVNMSATPNPAEGGTTLDVIVSITNNTGTDRTAVKMWLDYPNGLNQLFDSLFDGDCPSSACEPRERAVFDIPVLPAGMTMSFLVPPVVTGATPEGHVINFDVIAGDAEGGSSMDGDAFMVGTDFQSAVNADLTGSGSVGFEDLQNLLQAWGPCIGACLPDFDESGSVGFADLQILLQAWGPVNCN